MGRNKNFNSSSANHEKLNINADESQNKDLLHNDEENEDESVIEEQSRSMDQETNKNTRRQLIMNTIQSTKKGEFEEELKEVKRTRGRPRKTIVDVETQRGFKKSYAENDEDILKFENEDAFNLQLENSSASIIEIPETTGRVKEQRDISNFDIEAKISNESIITISSEENSNSNPILRALQCTPTLERNLPSPEVIHVQFNPSSTKTYKNKRKFINMPLNNDVEKTSSTDQNKIEESIRKDTQIDKNKAQIPKPSTNFEINPNFVRNTRKKVLKYDVCDLLNKKSHKKIQIEARIDSMPAKSKINMQKNLNANSNDIKIKPPPAKIIPKINDLQSIIRKFPPAETDFSSKDNTANIFSVILEQTPPTKSLIQIQGEIVADSRAIASKKISSQDLFDDSKLSTLYVTDQKNLGKTTHDNALSDTPIKRRPGRPKIKKDNLNLDTSTSLKNKVIEKILCNDLNSTASNIITEKTDKKLLKEFENANVIENSNDLILSLESPQQFQIRNSGITACEQNSPTKKNLEKLVTNFSVPIKSELPIKPKPNESITVPQLNCDLSSKKCRITHSPTKIENLNPKEEKVKDESEFANIAPKNLLEEITEQTETISTVSESDTKNNGLNQLTEVNACKEASKIISSNVKQNESLVSKNIKEVRILIKGVDNIKLKKSENCNFPENQFNSLNKSLQEEIKEKEFDILEFSKDIANETQIFDEECKKNSKDKTLLENQTKTPDKMKNSNENQNEKMLIGAENLVNDLNNVETFENCNDHNKNSKNIFGIMPVVESIKEIESFSNDESDNQVNKMLNKSNILEEKDKKYDKEEENEKINLFIETKGNGNECDEKILSFISNKLERSSQNYTSLLETSTKEKLGNEKNKDDSPLTSEKSEYKTYLQHTKPKEIKTGMDIWLEKVQLESKLKSLNDLCKKKTEKVFKSKSKEENKSKGENRTKHEVNFKLESPYKADHKGKDFTVIKEEQKLSNALKFKKETKDKFDNKNKLLIPKVDLKSKEDIKNKEIKDLIRQDKKIKDKDDKNKEVKIETKIKTDSVTQKQVSKTDKEDVKQRYDNNKSSKNELCSSTPKSETSLRTIDIFNFAAKDEIAQKVYNKKKNKKNETNVPGQDKVQVKFEISETKIENEKEGLQKKVILEKSPKPIKEKKNEKSTFNKEEEFDKNIEKEITKPKFDSFFEDNTKVKRRIKNVDEGEDIKLINSTSELDLKSEIYSNIEKGVEILKETEIEKENIKETLISNLCNIKPIVDVIEHGKNLSQCILQNSKTETLPDEQFFNLSSKQNNENEIINSEKESKSFDELITEEFDAKESQLEKINEDKQKDILTLSPRQIQEPNESTNEILDPLKDIESFLEAAGNLLSRSHSSDDEKESIGRRGMRKRSSDEKIISDQYESKDEITCDIEEKLKSIESDTEKTEITNKIESFSFSENKNLECYNKNLVPECVTQKYSEGDKTKLISDLIKNEEDVDGIKKSDSSHSSDFNILTPSKALQKEKREEWFSQIDSSIDKDLSDEVSFDSIINYNESTPVSKKIGTGPRTPPLPPPLSDEESDRCKSNNETVTKTNNFYDQSSLESDIANSIISTSIKIPNSMVTSLHELKFMGSPKDQSAILDEQLKLIENQISKKSRKKSESSQKDRELKKFLKTLKKNELSKDWKKTYKELKKIKKKSAECFAFSKSSIKYSPENDDTINENSTNSNVSQKIKKVSDEYSSTIRRSHRLKSIAMQQNQQIVIGRGGLVRNDYEDLIRADLAQVQAQNTKFLKAMENSLNQFKQINENEYKCERVISKEAKRMMCDCFLTKEEEERGEYGCGEDCLNRLLMIECGPKCNVGDRCTNKRFQRGQYAPCRVFMTEKKGCGIFAEVEIPAGEFIMEYVGEVVDSDQFEKRATEYSASKNKHFYFMSLRSNAIIDATSRGNISRFINHSCDPNAETQKWTVNGELHIGFFTTRAVASGEEITFDYQFQRYGKQAQRCYCEASNCRGWIGEEPDSDEEIEEEIEINFKSKEDLEQISKEVQSYADKDKQQTLEENISAQKLLSEKDNVEPVKITLTDEELKIKQQEREQRKKDKQRKREIRLAQQKHDFLEDPDLEDEIYRLSKTGLKNQVQTLRLSRLIVRAKLLQTRINLLEILRAGEIPCRRLFLDYHGLKLLHGWMNESESKDCCTTEDNLKMRLVILQTLNCLPIPNKTMLKESKVYQIVQNWIQDKVITISPIDGSASDSNSSHAIAVKDKSVDIVLDQNAKEIQSEIKNLAIKLINDWEVLPEVFRIPRKERVEQMKEHEREADRRYAALHVADDERDPKSNRDRYKKSRWDSSIKSRWSNKTDGSKDRRKNDQEKLDDGLTKEQRRQAFAAKVAQDEAEKLNAEKRRNLEYEARREFEFKCKFFLLDCTKTHPRDIPFCVDQKTNTWYTLDKRKIPTPPSHVHIKIPPRSKSTNLSDYKLPKMDLPPGWKFAIEPAHGRIYYYHVKIRRPQWEPPPKIYPLVNPENNTNVVTSGNNTIDNVNDNSFSNSSSSDSESLDEIDALSLLVQERAISPRKEEDRVYNQSEMRRYKENKEKIRRRKEEIKRRKTRILLKAGEQAPEDFIMNQLNESDPLPIADYLISSDEDDDTIVEELDSKLIEKIVKGESIVDELDALKIKKPLKRPLPIKEKSNGNGVNNSNVTAEIKKRQKLEDKKHKNSDEIKKSKSSNKNSRYFARKAKEKFRSDIAGIIVQHLQPYRKDSCQIGKITTNEDFKHLARKLTHFVMIKELKHCDSTGQTLIVTDSVKNKSREFIKKYMAKYGEIYIRPETDPEYKEIPL